MTSEQTDILCTTKGHRPMKMNRRTVLFGTAATAAGAALASVEGLANAATPPAAGSQAGATNPRDSLVYGEYKPDASTVGPLPGTVLQQFGTSATSTDFVATANNQVIQNMEIWGSVNLKSFTGVKIQNCRIHGTLARGVDTAHVFGSGGNLRGATIVDCALVGRPVTVPASYNGVANPDAGAVNQGNEWCCGIIGGNYTVLRTEMINTSDGLSLNSQVGNVTAKGCWIHNGWFNEWTPEQATPSGGPARYYPYSTGTAHYTHVDGIQFHRGRNYTFVGNRIGGTRVPGDHNVTPSHKNAINSGDDMYNAALMIQQNVDNTDANKIENVLIDRNWLAGGTCTLNITLTNGNYFTSMQITNNRFTRSTWGQQYYVLRQHDAAGVYVANFSGNVYEDDGTPVTITSGGVGKP
jgi:hypothetical protein